MIRSGCTGIARSVLVVALFFSARASSASEQADAPVAVALAKQRQFTLGAQFELFITVTHEPKYTVGLARPLELGSGLEEVSRFEDAVTDTGGQVTRSFRLVLQVFSVGEVEIPPLPITYTARGKTDVVLTNKLVVSVSGPVVDFSRATAKDISPPVAIMAPNWPLIVGTVAVMVFLIAAVAAVFARRWWRKRGPRVVVETVSRDFAEQLPADQEALVRLAEMESTGAVDAEDRKLVFLELSEIVRMYLGRRYDFPALDFTTAEIHDHLRRLDDPGVKASQLLSGWLETGDLVKFANMSATADEARQALYSARRFIEQTTPGASSTQGERA